MSDNIIIRDASSNQQTLRATDIAGVKITHHIISDTSGNVVPVVTAFNTGVKALRVLIGPTDPIGDIPVMIDYDHHQLHEGEVYIYCQKVTLANNATRDIRFVVPNITIPQGVDPTARLPHLRFEFIGPGADIMFYEGPTATLGTLKTGINRNRGGAGSTNTPQLSIYDAPTVTGVGTEIFCGMLTGTRTSGGSSEVSSEFVLKNNTQYLFRITNTSGTSGDFLLRFHWYEDLGV